MNLEILYLIILILCGLIVYELDGISKEDVDTLLGKN